MRRAGGPSHRDTHCRRPAAAIIRGQAGASPAPMPAAAVRRGVVATGVACAGVRRRRRRWPRRPQESPDLETTLARAAERVAEFFARAQSLVCTEQVHIQPLGYGSDRPTASAAPWSRSCGLSWDARADGDGGTEAQTRRQVIKVNGRPPRKNDHRATAPRPSRTTPRRSRCRCCWPSQRDDYAFDAGRPRQRVDKPAGDPRRLPAEGQRSPSTSRWSRATTTASPTTSTAACAAGCGSTPRPSTCCASISASAARSSAAAAPSCAPRPGVNPIWTLERHDTTYRFKRVRSTTPTRRWCCRCRQTSINITRGAGTPRLRTEHRVQAPTSASSPAAG